MGLLLVNLCHSSAQVNLNLGLIAQYNFTDESLDDLGPNFINLINNNGATPVEDRFGNLNSAYLFDGVDDYLSASNDPTLTLGLGATIALWVKLNDVTANQKLIGKLTTPPITLDGGYLIGIENGQVNVETWVVGSTAYSFVAGNVVANQWTHIAVTFQSTNYVVLHINGQAIDSVMVPDALEANSNDLIIGAAPWDPSYFKTNGVIDDIRMYNRKVNNAELNAIYTEVITGQNKLSNSSMTVSGSDGLFTFNAGTKQRMNKLVLTDVRGAICAEKMLNETQTEQLDLTQYNKGIYFATLYTTAGQKTFKLIN